MGSKDPGFQRLDDDCPIGLGQKSFGWAPPQRSQQWLLKSMQIWDDESGWRLRKSANWELGQGSRGVPRLKDCLSLGGGVERLLPQKEQRSGKWYTLLQ